MGRRSKKEREELISRFRTSGQTQRAFAAAHGISEHTLSNWLTRLSEPATPFIEIPSQRTEVELRFADGTELVVRG